MRQLALCALFAIALSFHPSASWAAVDPCKVLTTAEASKALGQSVVRTQERDFGHPSCSYKSARFSSLVVTTELFPSPSEAKNEYHATITNPAMRQSPSVKLNGIGDDAQRLGSMVLVLKNSSIYGFNIIGPDANSSGPERLIALARVVAPRM